jgi:hypothetical protein
MTTETRPPSSAVAYEPNAEPWCSGCGDHHSIDTSCSDNAKRYDVDWQAQAADLQRRIDKAYPYLTAIRYAPYLKDRDAARWAAEAQAALTTLSASPHSAPTAPEQEGRA